MQYSMYIRIHVLTNAAVSKRSSGRKGVQRSSISHDPKGKGCFISGGGGGGGMLPVFLFCSLFPVQQTTSGIGHVFGLATNTLNVRNRKLFVGRWILLRSVVSSLNAWTVLVFCA